MADLLEAVPAASQGGPRIDTVGDVTKDLGRRFPKQRDEILAWHDSYFRVLGKLAPEALRKTYYFTIDTWERAYAPKPAEFGKTARETVSTGIGTRIRENRDAVAARSRAARHRLIDETLRTYADRMASEAEQLGVPLEGPQGYIDALSRSSNYGLDRMARDHMHDKPPLAHLELTEAHFEHARCYVETWRRLASAGPHTPMLTASRAASREYRPDSAREERRRAALARAAAAFHDQAGHELTEAERNAIFDEASASQQQEAQT